jgi:glycosyltransferase involved in cell wall biosynthesis
MRIAQIAPLIESVPPRGYGGTERIVAYLTDELVQLGHDVTLFATADSKTAARLIPCADIALRLDSRVQDAVPHHLVMLDRVRRQASSFDILHFHLDLLHLPLFAGTSHRTLTTLHGRLDLPDLRPFYATFGSMPQVSISMDQRRPLQGLVQWAGNIPHGLPPDLLPFEPSPAGDYLAFLGRFSPEKGPEAAIEIARRAGLPLHIAAKVDRQDRKYWETVLVPKIESSSHVECLGEIDDAMKASFLGNAKALLFPIDWPEPFGLVLIEAMACGTPVIAYGGGAVPEIIEHRVNGFIVDSVAGAASALREVHRLDREVIRARFDERFTARRMAADYVETYSRLLEAQRRTG